MYEIDLGANENPKEYMDIFYININIVTRLAMRYVTLKRVINIDEIRWK